MQKARKEVGTIHGIVYPELALANKDFEELVAYIELETNLELLCCGLRERNNFDRKPSNNAPSNKYIGKNSGSGTERSNESIEIQSNASNEAAMVSFNRLSAEERARRKTPDYDGTRSRNRTLCIHQKHHRWRLNEEQIVGYGLSSVLDPSITWWEDLRILNRKLPFVTMRDRWSLTTLICEDLARVDPAQEMVRAIGPNLVLSLVMDGPQLDSRWSARYATVLAEDPGSAVLTVNSLGLINRSREVRELSNKPNPDSNAIALWRDDRGVSIPIELPVGSHAACLTIVEHATTDFTLDGRDNGGGSTALRLGNWFPVKLEGEEFKVVPDPKY